MERNLARVNWAHSLELDKKVNESHFPSKSSFNSIYIYILPYTTYDRYILNKMQVRKAIKTKTYYFEGHEYDAETIARDFMNIDGAEPCRSDQDCDWMLPNLRCDDREFNMSEVKVRKIVRIKMKYTFIGSNLKL